MAAPAGVLARRLAVISAGLRLECATMRPAAAARFSGKQVPRSFAEWIDFLYGPFFRVIGFFYRTYTANRARFARFTESAGVSILLKSLAILILVGWFLIWYFAPDEDRNRLTEEDQQTLEGLGGSSGD